MKRCKYRGKQTDNGEWVYGIPIGTKIGTYIITEENPHVCNQYGYMEIDEFFPVDPETVGQYTGLKDCKRTEKYPEGQDIYEGDIFKRLDTGDTFKVIWKDDCYLATHMYDAWLEKDITQRSDNVSLHFMTTYKIEIIGNIHSGC